MFAAVVLSSILLCVSLNVNNYLKQSHPKSYGNTGGLNPESEMIQGDLIVDDDSEDNFSASCHRQVLLKTHIDTWIQSFLLSFSSMFLNSKKTVFLCMNDNIMAC